MLFPETQRVTYKKNLLDRVICQLRFPPILRIDKESPVEFQDAIRKNFPEFQEKEEITLPQSMQQEVPFEVLRQIIPSEIKNYQFSSKEGFWTVNLTHTFVALITRKYKNWEEFKSKLDEPLKALNNSYEPAYFSRIGLRYVDIINRKVLGLEKFDWNELLQPYVLGLLSSTDVNKVVQRMEAKYEIRLNDESDIARISTGLVEQDNGEVCFMIDTDFFNTEKTDISNALNKLDFFHAHAFRLIRWLITDRLHDAMEPLIK